MVNTLISAPSWASDQIYLPYIYGVLKTFADRDPELKETVNWLKPIYFCEKPREAIHDYDLRELDILGLSCYTWNWFAQQAIADEVKQVNPDCLVVAGGPHCDYDNPDFFDENPYIDLIVKQDGHVPFREILRCQLDDDRELESIPGLYLPGEDGVPTLTDSPHLLDEEEIPATSPFQAQSETFRQIIREIEARDEPIAAVWETNRGCPYHCSFCDWGSLTFTKVRKFSMERVQRDINWLTEHGVHTIYSTDANMGIFDRDPEIIRHLCERKEKHGFPKVLIYNPTKSKATHLPGIVRNLHDSGLVPRAVMSIQHTNPDVLDAMDRKNLTKEEIDDLVAFNRANDIPMFVQLILGSPRDTYESWQVCLTDLMEWGIHGDYHVFNFDILPNAPAADDEYMEEWGIETTVSTKLPAGGTRKDKSSLDLAKKNLITRTSTFSRKDWMRMWAYTYFVQAFHNMGLTRRVVQYFHHLEDVSYLQFYRAITDELAGRDDTLFGDFYRSMIEDKEKFLENPRDRYLDRTTLSNLPGYPYNLKWEEWLYVQVALHRERAFYELESFLLERFDVPEERVRDLMKFQHQSLVWPAYDPASGKTFTGRFDWPEYFDRAEEQYSDPPLRERRRFVIDQRKLGRMGDGEITWAGLEGDERIHRWIDRVVREPYQRPDLLTMHEVESQPVPSLFERVRRGASRSIRKLAGSA